MVDLFAGLRTVHLAAVGTGLTIVLSDAAEKCTFANHLAQKKKIKENIFDDVKKMDKHWAKGYMDRAKEVKAQLILLIGGFPCKGLSMARGDDRENLDNKNSILFYEALRILREIRQAAGGSIPIVFIIENVMMDEEPIGTVLKKLGCHPTKEKQRR